MSLLIFYFCLKCYSNSCVSLAYTAAKSKEQFDPKTMHSKAANEKPRTPDDGSGKVEVISQTFKFHSCQVLGTYPFSTGGLVVCMLLHDQLTAQTALFMKVVRS